MKIHIKTYGCQMNERDSGALAGMFARDGHTITEFEEDADVLIFNTCSVRESAERKAIGKIGFMRKLKKKNPSLIIGAVGCMAQARGNSLFAELPHLDFVLGTGQLHRISEIIESILAERRQVALLKESDAVLTAMGNHYGERPFSAYIAITRGCNRFCSYCIVPYVRGREYSREIADVVSEAKMLAGNGVREIILLGQNVAAYGLNGNVNPPPPEHSPFADLLEELQQIDGLERIRFTSPYVTYFNDRLIRTLGRCSKVCNGIHLPLQSGSDRILKAMNRQYDAAIYREKVAAIREAMEGVTFSTDVIVGFPGEEESDFNATRELMEEVGFDNAFIFKYSPRPGTKAADSPDQIPQEVKEARNQILLADLARCTKAHMEACVGRTFSVLAEGVSRRNAERWSGKTTCCRTVNFLPVAGMKPGDIVNVNITRAGAVSLFGSVLSPDESKKA